MLLQHKGQGRLKTEKEERRGNLTVQETPALENLEGEAPQTSQLLVEEQRV